MMHDRLRLAALLLSSVPALTAQAAGWTSPVAVSPSGNPDPTRGAQVDSIAVNAGALSVASWDQYFYTGNGGSSVGVSVERNGRWGTPVTLSNPATYSDRAQTAVGRDGTMVVAWASQTSSGRTIEAAVWPAGADGWIGPVVLGSGYLRVSPDPSAVRVAVDATGEAWVAWSIFDGAHYVVQAAYRPPGVSAQFATATTLSTTGEDAIQPALALNDLGVVAIAWAGSPWQMSTSPNTITVRKSLGNVQPFSAPVRVAPDLSRYTGYQNSPSMCIDRNGLTTVLWMGGGVQGNLETIDGQWKGVESVIPPVNSQTSYVSTSLACDSQGRAIAAATMFDGTRGQVWAATLDEGAWTAARKLTGITPRKIEDIAMSSAAMSPDGTLAFIAYVDHYNGVVKAVHRSGAGWGTPYLIGKTAYVSSFAEMVDASADLNGQGRVIWKTKGGALHLVSDWKP
jgi:hypothetical protein